MIHLLSNARSRFRCNIRFLFIYFDGTNTVDPSIIIIISLVVDCHYYIVFTDEFVFLVFNSYY
jgi:hypothetical protein